MLVSNQRPPPRETKGFHRGIYQSTSYARKPSANVTQCDQNVQHATGVGHDLGHVCPDADEYFMFEQTAEFDFRSAYAFLFGHYIQNEHLVAARHDLLPPRKNGIGFLRVSWLRNQLDTADPILCECFTTARAFLFNKKLLL